MVSEVLLAARAAYRRKAWPDACQGFRAAALEGGLELDDFEQQAIATHMTGKSEESREILAGGYREAVRLGANVPAARFAFWLGHGLIFQDRMSEASGWFARGRQLMADQDADCAEHGYLLIPQGVEQLMTGDNESAAATLARAHDVALRCGDLSLLAMSAHGQGRALIRQGRIAEGLAALDEAIVVVASGEVSPMAIGEVYCSALEACHEVLDVRRAREWTGALTRWCDSQMDLVPFRGPCQVYRAEVMQFHGAWTDAFEEAQRACEWLSLTVSPEGPADAFYRVGELHRLRGAYAEAEEAYRTASRLGRRPEPGLPLLWLVRGQASNAHAALERALAEEREPARRAALLDAMIQLLLGEGDAPAARGYIDELGGIAAALESPVVRAWAATAEGAAALAEQAPGEALGPLRRAWTDWQRLEAPYEAAKVRVLLGATYHALGDHEFAAMEFDAARWVFEQLGATPDLARIDELTSRPSIPGGLTSREIDVLRLVAAGETNRAIGQALVISEHTVARHVQNMLAKLGCTSRTALAAFAVEHHLAEPPGGQH